MTFSFENIWISILFAMRFKPHNKSKCINGRHQHSFMLVEEGEYRYSFDGQTFNVNVGEMVYLPKGAVYNYEIVSESCICCQVEFDINNLHGGFAEHPIKLCITPSDRDTLVNIVSICDTSSPSKYFEALGLLYRMCSAFSEEIFVKQIRESRISAAVDFIENHFSERINIDMLARMCYVSTSQLRRLFKKEYGLSPVAYKNSLRIEKAKRMLVSGNKSVGEVGAELGFNDVYIFSSTFKKHAGISPTVFIGKVTNKEE